MTILESDLKKAGHYVVSEDIYLSREQVMLRGDGKVESGTVLGRLLVGGAVAAAKAGGNTGNATISAVTTKKGVKPGVYRVEFTAATKFDVNDPEGVKGKSGTTGVAYADDLGFTITVGVTPMVAGDAFDITVSKGDDVYGPLDLAAGNGLETAAAILWEARTPGEDDDKRCVVTARESQVVLDLLTWPDGITTDQRIAATEQLAALHIIMR